MGENAPRSTVAAFAADPTSCSQARAFVRDSLASMGIDSKVADVAVLVASELVTNAVLHAHAGPVVTVHNEKTAVRIEVEDSSEMFPLVRGYSTDAVTGRGLDVIEASASNWGVVTTQNGKTVWAEFQLDSAAHPGVAEMPPRSTTAFNVAGGDAPDGFPILFRDVPVDAYLLLEQHHEALLREFELLMIGMESESTKNTRIDPAVVALVKKVHPILSARLSSLRPQIAGARAEGRTHCDMNAVCDDSLIEWSGHFERLMAEAERLSREGLLLTSPAPPVVLALRHWFLDEMMRQYVDRIPPRRAPVFDTLN